MLQIQITLTPKPMLFPPFPDKFLELGPDKHSSPKFEIRPGKWRGMEPFSGPCQSIIFRSLLLGSSMALAKRYVNLGTSYVIEQTPLM